MSNAICICRRPASWALTMPGEGPHGWLVIDKPLGLSAKGAVDRVRRGVGIKAGHAGTLDPMATGVLPVALGHATKTIAYAMMGRKCYRFRIRWGIARSTDDREGEVVEECRIRPSREAIEAALPGFTGTILQVPPAYSAIKIGGRRAYALARAAAPLVLAARPVRIVELRLIATPDCDHADCEAVVGKGTYIRALVRDLAAALGTCAHVVALRRLSVGRFTETQAISLDSLADGWHSLARSGYLLPIETALDDIPALILTGAEAARLCCGQTVMPSDLRRRADLGWAEGSVVAVWHDQALIALARIENRSLRPVRIIKC
jgi:tRNA pseudouridine55 synthase